MGSTTPNAALCCVISAMHRHERCPVQVTYFFLQQIPSQWSLLTTNMWCRLQADHLRPHVPQGVTFFELFG